MENTMQPLSGSPAETRPPNYLLDAFAAMLAPRDHANAWDVSEVLSHKWQASSSDSRADNLPKTCDL